MTMKLVKTAAALALGASLVTSAVVPADASAASKYKVSKGKLVVAKTGKVATGYVTYNKTVYKSGVKLTGLKGKVYYKAGKKATGTYKGAYYVSGAKKVTTGTYNKAYYVKGVKKVTTGLYGSTYYKSGKKATGTYKGAYYVNGAKKATTGTYNKAYYVKGKKVVATGTYNKAYYVDGKKVVATGTYDKAYYVDGKEVVTDGLFAEKLYTEGALNVGYKLYDAKLFKDADLNKGLVSFEEKVYNDAELAEGTFEFEGKEEAFEKGIKVGAKVASVEAINGTQVKVTFNKTVDAKTVLKDVKVATALNTAATATVTKVGDTTPNVFKSAKVEGKTVTLTLTTALQGENLVIIDGLKTTADEKVNRYSQVVNFAADKVAPTIAGTEQVSSTSAKVEFSEALSNLGTVSFKTTDGKEVTGITQATAFASGDNSVTYDLTAAKVGTENLTDGTEVVVTYIGAQDIALNLINPNPATTTIKKVAADKVAAVVSSITQTGAKEITVKFDKAIKDIAAVNFDKFTVSGSNLAKSFEKVSDTEYKVVFTNALEGVQTVTVAKAIIVNMDGLAAGTDYSKLITFTKDEVAPKATSKVVTAKDGKEYLELTFDKDIELTTGVVSITGSYTEDYINTDLAAGITATAEYANIDAITKLPTNKKVILVPLVKDATANKNLAIEGATYKLKVTSTDLKSASDIKIADIESTFTRGKDSTVSVPTTPNKELVTSLVVGQGSNADEVKVTFTFKKGEKLEGASATNIANYSVANAEIESVTLSAAVEGGTVSTQEVTLKLKKNSNTFTGVRNATVKNVKIANSTEVMTEKSVVTTALAENVRATILSAKVTGSKEITVTFSEGIKSINKDSFVVKSGTDVIALDTAGTAVVTGGNTAKIALLADLNADQLAKAITVESAKLTDGKVDTTKYVITDANDNVSDDFASVTVVKP